MRRKHSQDTAQARSELARLWMQAQPTVASFIAAAVRNPHDVDDLLQEVAVAAARDFDQYDPSRPFAHWAIGIARYRVLNHLRQSQGRAVALDPQAVGHLADASMQLHEQVSDVHLALESCLNELDGRSREAIRVRYREESSITEVGRRFNLTATAAAALLYRVRKALARCIQRKLSGEASP